MPPVSPMLNLESTLNQHLLGRCSVYHCWLNREMTEEEEAAAHRAGGGGEGAEARQAKDAAENGDEYCQGLLGGRATLLAEGMFVRDRGRKAMV